MSKVDEISDKLKKNKTIKKTVIPPSSIQKLSNIRIIQKHLVYVIGLSSSLSNKDVLSKYEYFGQYGNILKVVVNKTKAYNPNGPNGPSYSAYISYSTSQEASVAILAIDNIEVDDHLLRASYGTTKYCTFFLKNLECPNKDCLYLHYLADESDIINKDDMNSNTNIFYEQQILAMKLADIFNTEVKKKLKTISKKKSIFPSTDTIYGKDIVIEQESNISTGTKFYSSSSANKYKKKYNEDYYNYYDRYENYNEFNNNENELSRQKSESFSKYMNEDIDKNSKFISKSKSPITIKKKITTSSVSPNQKKISLDIKGKEISQKENNLTPIVTQKKFYYNRERSRFDFVKNENDSNLVPQHVTDLICKKISRHSFFKKFFSEFEKKNINDCIYFEKELKKKDSWSEFILNNMISK